MYTFAADGMSAVIKFYPKQTDGSDSSEQFSLSVEPNTGVCGTLSQEQQGSDAGGPFVQATYTAPNAVPPNGTNCLFRATGNQGTDCTEVLNIVEVGSEECCPTIDGVELGSLIAGGSLSGQISATAPGGGSVNFTVVSAPSGVSVSSAGVISGTVPDAGSHSLRVTASDGTISCDHLIQFVTTGACDDPTPACPAVQRITLGQLVAGEQLTGQITAASQNGGTISVTGVSMPGTTAVSSSGALSGTLPATAGTYEMELAIADQDRSCGTIIEFDVREAAGVDCPVVGSINLPALVAGNAMSGSISATSDNGNVTFAGVSLPTGVTISSGGVLGGTVPAAGTYQLVVSMSDDVITCSLNVNIVVVAESGQTTPSCPAVTGVTLGQLVAGQAISGSVSAVSQNGGQVTYELSAGPNGWIINSTTGVLSGIAPASGLSSLVVTTSDGDVSCDTTVNFFVAEAAADPACPRVSAVNLGSLVAGQTVSGSISTSGEGNVQLAQTGLPQGMTLTTSGVLSGTAPVAGTYTLNLTLTDDNTSCDTAISFVVQPSASTQADCPDLQSIAIDELVEGQVATGTIAATGNGVVRFSATGLPTGVTLSQQGQFGGIAPAAGFYVIAITMVDDDNVPCTFNYRLVVSAAASSACPKLGSILLPTATVGQQYTGFVVMTGAGSVRYALGGTSNGLTINPTSGQISGVYTGAVGNSSRTLTVTDDNGSCDYTLSFQAQNPPDTSGSNCCPRLVNVPVLQGTVGQAFSAQLFGAPGSGTGAVAFRALSGLPSWLSLSSSGLFSGTPDSEASYSIQIELSDGVNDPCNVTVAVKSIAANDTMPPDDDDVGELCVRLMGVYEDWKAKHGHSSVTEFNSWIAGASQAFTYWREQNPESGDTFADFTVWISRQPDCPDAEECDPQKYGVWLQCDKTICGVEYHASMMHPAYVVVDLKTRDHLLANGDATAALQYQS